MEADSQFFYSGVPWDMVSSQSDSAILLWLAYNGCTMCGDGYLHANALLESELNSSWQCELARRTEAGLKLCCLPDATLKESEVHLKQ